MDTQENNINTNNIIWINANMEWFQRTIYEYNKIGKDLGMDYLSLGALRYDNQYFVGYLFNMNNIECPTEIVCYLQYKKQNNELNLNYLEVSKKYRGNGISKLIIDKFFEKQQEEAGDNKLKIVTSLISKDGQTANLLEKLEDNVKDNVTEVSKRNMI